MSRSYEEYLADILKAARRITEIAGSLDLEQLQSMQAEQESVLWNLTIIGEAVKHLPEHIRLETGTLDWRRAAAMRDKIVHGYFGIKWELLHDTIHDHIPVLIRAVEELLEDVG